VVAVDVAAPVIVAALVNRNDTAAAIDAALEQVTGALLRTRSARFVPMPERLASKSSSVSITSRSQCQKALMVIEFAIWPSRR